MPSPYDAIRAELAAAHKTRDGLMKWKLIAVTVVAAAALGFSESSPSGAYLALAVIPFACAYVDLLCRNLSVRSKRVSRFLSLQTGDDPVVRFEKFYAKTKVRPALESVALVGSSVVLSIVIVPIGVLIAAGQNRGLSRPYMWPESLFWGAGVLGLVMAVGVEVLYELQKREIEIELPSKE